MYLQDMSYFHPLFSEKCVLTLEILGQLNSCIFIEKWKNGFSYRILIGKNSIIFSN